MKLSLCNVLAVTHTHTDTHSVDWARRLSSFSSAEVSTTESSKAQTCQKGEILSSRQDKVMFKGKYSSLKFPSSAQYFNLINLKRLMRELLRLAKPTQTL